MRKGCVQKLAEIIEHLESVLQASRKMSLPDRDKLNSIKLKHLADTVDDRKIKNKKKPFIVSIEGNIGCGKSTMLNYFNRYPDVELIPEPVPKWCNMNGHNLLGKMYEEPKRWSFQFQSYVQLTRLQLLKKPTDCSVKIIERCLQNNRYCFLENHRKEDTLVTGELSVLCKWFDFLDNNMDVQLDLIVYLRTSPEVAYKRIMARGRKEEAGVPMQFIENLHKSHEDWLIEKKFGPLPAPLLVLDADKGIESMLETYDLYQDQIRGMRPFTEPLSSAKKNNMQHTPPLLNHVPGAL